jgi:endonuclease YncB( thermonuclease family)
MISQYFTAVILLAATAVPHAKPWERLDDCKWIPNRWNDGDSFHVQTSKGEIVARLYFVDTPEAETAYRDRLDEQSAYFGITREQAGQIAHEATQFTREQLEQPFSVWTRWRFGLGRSAIGRRYCLIYTVAGEDLNELLVKNGLARIYGTRTQLPDGRDSRAYLARLKEIEAKAKADKQGAWRFNSTE